MTSRVACIAIAAMLTLTGCTSMVYYSVVTPHEAVNDDQGCFRQCQLVHAGETKRYMACLRNCPGIRIVDDAQCRDVSFDAQRYQCNTEHAQKFDPTFGIIAIALGVAAMIAIAASAPSGTQ